MDMTELVRKARTTRRFDESRPVTDQELRSLVDAARVSSCGGNAQPLRYRLVSDPAECRKVFPLVAWAASIPDWPGPSAGERPTGYIAICAESKPGMDTGIAAQTIQLCAAGRGIGACMMGAIQRSEIKQALHIDEKYNLMLLIALGRPAETIVIDEVAAGTDLTYYRGDDGVHHVPKLRLQDVLIG